MRALNDIRRAVHFTWLFPVLVALLTIQARADDAVPPEVDSLFVRFVDAVKASDTAAVREMYAPESQPYCGPSESLVRRFWAGTIGIDTVTEHDGHLRVDAGDKLEPAGISLTFYLVERDDGLRFQFPFILFASDWPVKSSAHFRYHVDPALPDSAAIDTTAFESLMARIDSLTGLSPQHPFDYYLCADTATARSLVGIDSNASGEFGWCVVSPPPPMSAVFPRLLLTSRPARFDFLDNGVVRFAVRARKTADTTGDSGDLPDSIMVRLLNEVTPDTLDVLLWNDVLGLGLGGIVYFAKQMIVGMETVTYLVADGGDARFRDLYRRSTDADSFKAALQDVYGLTPAALLDRLRAKYSDR